MIAFFVKYICSHQGDPLLQIQICDLSPDVPRCMLKAEPVQAEFYFQVIFAGYFDKVFMRVEVMFPVSSVFCSLLPVAPVVYCYYMFALHRRIKACTPVYIIRTVAVFLLSF